MSGTQTYFWPLDVGRVRACVSVHIESGPSVMRVCPQSGGVHVGVSVSACECVCEWVCLHPRAVCKTEITDPTACSQIAYCVCSFHITHRYFHLAQINVNSLNVMCSNFSSNYTLYFIVELCVFGSALTLFCTHTLTRFNTGCFWMLHKSFYLPARPVLYTQSSNSTNTNSLCVYECFCIKAFAMAKGEFVCECDGSVWPLSLSIGRLDRDFREICMYLVAAWHLNNHYHYIDDDAANGTVHINCAQTILKSSIR